MHCFFKFVEASTDLRVLTELALNTRLKLYMTHNLHDAQRTLTASKTKFQVLSFLSELKRCKFKGDQSSYSYNFKLDQFVSILVDLVIICIKLLIENN